MISQWAEYNVSTWKDMVRVHQCEERDSRKYENLKKYLTILASCRPIQINKHQPNLYSVWFAS